MKTLQSWTAARKLADRTPPERNRYADLLRASSILVVVIGHWLMAAPQLLPDGTLRAGHLLADVPWTQALTWLLQVMPVFFFVGGFSNAASWRAARRDAVPYGQWLRDRLRRLLLPVLPLLAVWTGIALVSLEAGVDGHLLHLGSQAALVPVWFLATYVIVVMAAPATVAAWERYGWALPALLAVAAAVVDVASLGFGVPGIEWVNYLFVWNAVHALGYAWRDGRMGETGRRLAIAGAGLATLATLVAAGPYPLAMVGLDGAEVTNSNPPRVTLIALALFQFGIALALERPMRRLLEKKPVWTAVVAVNGSIMTLYLWHLTALVATVGVGMALGTTGLGIPVGSPSWWLTRPVWIGILASTSLPLIAVFARFERPSPDHRPAPPAWRPALAVACSCAGLGLLAANGIVDGGGLNSVALVLPVIGVLAGGLVGARHRPVAEKC